MKTTITLLREHKDDDKLAPQAKAIVVAVKEKFGLNKEVERQEVIDLISKDGVLTTRQEPARILSFYQPKLTELGIVKINKIAEPKPEKTETDKDGKTTTKATGAAPSASKPKDVAGDANKTAAAKS